ncbi:alpha-L-rhamnosidase-related protein [Rufibacter roseus]|uniref:Glycogen debranching protein n=2 Tax=Rufibacter roseus TaxID=1567108 RepID=A0ABW2DQV3_9BACT|nr:glycogen debranching protein [Rufibacter roseus]
MYTSDAFQLFHNRVVQGNFVAEALSPTHLRSSYQSPANQTFSRLLEYKFSLNGKDNELPMGVNHRLVLQPEQGKIETPVVVFGKATGQNITKAPDDFLEPNVEVTFRVDLRPVLQAFEKEGYYTAFNGEKLYETDFKGVFIAGGSEPLTWDFENLPNRQHLQLTDSDKDGIYTVTLTFNAYNPENFTASEWKLERDLSKLPQYSSDQVLLDALYNMSLEEMLLDIRPDSTFMAGEKWDGVWTRDISYSILLSLAAIEPQLCLNSLRRKVKDGRIVQDTGTGGSWPISSDRTTWALAAWEVYKVTGDKEWLREAYSIIKKTAEEDLATVVDHGTGLFRGESSFLDWRKQTYPAWMEPVDIYLSLNLGTNVVHYQTYQILAQMAELLEEPANVYRQTAEHINKGINQLLWVPEKKYYGQFLYGRQNLTLSPRSEALGEALAILFNVANKERKEEVLANSPQTPFGTPSIYPYIPEIPPYHNNSMWPFVQAYWTWAAAQEGHTQVVSQSMAALYRAAALFLTNKENLVAETGDYKGTEINSDRQLWSVAGNLAMVYRVFFGMQYEQNKLVFNPVVPESYAGNKKLQNFPYRNATLTLELEGYGTKLEKIYLDGKSLAKAEIPANLTGHHTLKMVLANDKGVTTAPNLVQNAFSPITPVVTYTNGTLNWSPVKGAASYNVYRNGKAVSKVTTNSFKVAVPAKGTEEYQISTIGSENSESFLSEPVLVTAPTSVQLIESEVAGNSKAHNAAGFTGSGYIQIAKGSPTPISWKVSAPQDGLYSVDFRYANGNGPINTDNKAAIRTLTLDKQRVGAVVFPQRGFEEWSNWGYSNHWQVYLTKGEHTFSLSFEPSDENMNGEINEALLDHLRLIYIKEK